MFPRETPPASTDAPRLLAEEAGLGLAPKQPAGRACRFALLPAARESSGTISKSRSSGRPVRPGVFERTGDPEARRSLPRARFPALKARVPLRRLCNLAAFPASARSQKHRAVPRKFLHWESVPASAGE